jgi:hypothetical protein
MKNCLFGNTYVCMFNLSDVRVLLVLLISRFKKETLETFSTIFRVGEHECADV